MKHLLILVAFSCSTTSTVLEARALRLDRSSFKAFGDSTHGGDPVQVAFAKGKRQALHIIENVRGSEFCRATSRPQDCDWFMDETEDSESGNGGSNVKGLAEKLRNASLEWPDADAMPAAGKEYCAHIQSSEETKIFLSRDLCRDVTSIAKAGEILIHEAWHLLYPRADDEATPTAIADAFYTAWEYAGHKLDRSLQSITTKKAPVPRLDYSAVWTGSSQLPMTPNFKILPLEMANMESKGELMIWGGRSKAAALWVPRASGSSYDPVLDQWNSVSGKNAPSARAFHTAVWTGSEMIVWGGRQRPTFATDAKAYNSETREWRRVSNTNAPLPRFSHSAVWTGSEMMVWGGCAHPDKIRRCKPTRSGGLYNPNSNTWRRTIMDGAPSPRLAATLIWTKGLAFVWGGYDSSGPRNDGAMYDPEEHVWIKINPVGAPKPRFNYTAVWTGSQIIIWGGNDAYGSPLADGAIFDIKTNTWTSMNDARNIPVGRSGHVAVWTGSHMLIYGGRTPNPVEPEAATGSSRYTTIALYHPKSNSWQTPSYDDIWMDRRFPAYAWTGHELVTWGGIGESALRKSGRVFYPHFEQPVNQSVNLK